MTAVNGATPGFFEGPLVTIPDYTSGPVTFEILAWTQDYHYDNLDGFGFSSFYIWTEPSIAPVPEPAGFFTSLPGNIYLNLDVPEPTTLALAGLGALVSLVVLRRQHS
jgi:PEP-CTERM motif